MGTNSFKMTIIHADSNGKFVTINRLKESVVLGRDTAATTISDQSQLRALEALIKFKHVIQTHRILKSHTRCVATAALREAANQNEFTDVVKEKTGFEVDVLSGKEEGRLCYLGVLQFLPIYQNLSLIVDIGGGSTEFVIGKEGKVLFGTSLKLGHVSLTLNFCDIMEMREHIRMVIRESGLVKMVKQYGYDVAVGSSGTIRAIEKAVFRGYPNNMNHLSYGVELLGGCKSDLKFSRGELRSVVQSLCGGGEEEMVQREGIFKGRLEFIVAGAVLLEEVFEILGIEEMEISGYALLEGVIAERLAEVYDGYDLKANARWLSVLRLATRFNSKKRMQCATQCAAIAKMVFEGLRKCNELGDVSLDDEDLEYIEAACLLLGIGNFTGKKGYHKQSFHIIMNGDHLHGYKDEEIKLLALLTRHHRKKFPKFNHSSFKEFTFKEFTKEVKQKFMILCSVVRISYTLQQYQGTGFQAIEFSHSCEGFKMVFVDVRDQSLVPTDQPCAEDIGAPLKKELVHFKKVCRQEFFAVVTSKKSELKIMLPTKDP